jgi:hypothetical protein
LSWVLQTVGLKDGKGTEKGLNYGLNPFDGRNFCFGMAGLYEQHFIPGIQEMMVLDFGGNERLRPGT